MKRSIFSVIKNSTIHNTNLEEDSEKSNSKIFRGKKITKISWSKDEDKLLLSLTKNNTRKKWSEIANYFQNKTPSLCQLRYLKINPSIKNY